ncbi:hypothetical protein LTR05_001516 [Lithohypha guttulata]|uniref:L-lactate dehydrogenase (cytochrome) n=1 Tax=Lithohypha guttulata TaxID=1690604 RepID=A0AAN7T6H4_9EURO|nr:hypothetical protein LTR05_001516 [Lithohypha guttulata]
MSRRYLRSNAFKYSYSEAGYPERPQDIVTFRCTRNPSGTQASAQHFFQSSNFCGIMRTISGAQLAEHKSRQSCWLAVHGKVYDVTGFINDHPGGAGLLLKSAGKDATSAYQSIHNPELISETLPQQALLGEVDTSTIPVEQQESDVASIGQQEAQSEYPALSSIINVDDFEQVAQRYLSPEGWAYYSSSAEDETSKQDNARLFRMLKLRPRVLRDVRAITTSTKILGSDSSVPFFICPTGLAKYAHAKAELNLASAAGAENVHQIIPTSPSMSLEQITEARSSPIQTQYLQVYVNRDKEKALSLIRRAEKAGVKGLFITVDSPVLGKREKDDRLKALSLGSSAPNAGVAKIASSTLLNPGLKWQDLDWIRSATKLPLVVKGVQTVEDAVLAYKHGLDAIYLSNHGGRSQDTAQAPILTLLEIRKHAPELIKNKKIEIYVDGNIRRGTDVIKCLALGATAVGIGRPCLYSMTGGYGEEGVKHMISILKSELLVNMGLIGATSIDELVPAMINTMRAEMEVFGGVKL